MTYCICIFVHMGSTGQQSTLMFGERKRYIDRKGKRGDVVLFIHWWIRWWLFLFSIFPLRNSMAVCSREQQFEMFSRGAAASVFCQAVSSSVRINFPASVWSLCYNRFGNYNPFGYFKKIMSSHICWHVITTLCIHYREHPYVHMTF